MIGTSPGAAKVALHRARRRLRTALELELLVRRKGSDCPVFAELLKRDRKLEAAGHAAGCEECQKLLEEELELYEATQQQTGAFVVLDAGSPGEKRMPVSGRLVIGRECPGVEEARRLLIDDATVSRHHLEIRFEPDLGRAQLIDLSANGTRLNGTRVERGVMISLDSGALIELGGARLHFESAATRRPNQEGAKTTLRQVSSGPMVMVVGDIVGYSRIAEVNEPAEVTEALEALFGELRSLLRLHGGMLANYAGDAFFGAWELGSIANGCERALLFTLHAAELVRRIAPELQLRDADGEPLRLGWGITEGKGAVSVLNGALTTVVGEPANVAFHLSGLANRGGRSEILAQASLADCAGFSLDSANSVEIV